MGAFFLFSFFLSFSTNRNSNKTNMHLINYRNELKKQRLFPSLTSSSKNNDISLLAWKKIDSLVHNIIYHQRLKYDRASFGFLDVYNKAMRSGNIFKIRCIFWKIRSRTQKFWSGISGGFLFWGGGPKFGLFQKVRK